jgi:hypothetical protein
VNVLLFGDEIEYLVECRFRVGCAIDDAALSEKSG